MQSDKMRPPVPKPPNAMPKTKERGIIKQGKREKTGKKSQSAMQSRQVVHDKGEGKTRVRDKIDRLASLSPVDESIDPHVADAGQPPAVTNVRAGALAAGAPHLALRLLPSTGIRARSGARA